MSPLRCAIYTRKSSEEGLEQSFNSLDAQREACDAYIVSQKSEGWKALPTLYDDGGYSGGNMDRPALQRLMHDIAARRVDIVVVYKVDRLTRSLADFAKIVEVFDEHQVSFVSVTQAFNTTSSMGRLTLNVLLSFAQFEREVTGERIRDKIAASKAKGMWMGGYPPLGYDVEDRALVAVPEEAERVRHIFERYLTLKSVRALAQELGESGIRSKVRRLSNGDTRGGTIFSRGALFHLLRNRIYVGEIVHKQNIYPGQHEPIVALDQFEKVQLQLAINRIRPSDRRFDSAPLIGRVIDSFGTRMSPVHAYGKNGRRYRYYVSGEDSARKGSAEHVSRVSAHVLEEIVLDRMRSLIAHPEANWTEVLQHLREVEVHARSVTLNITGISASRLNSSAATSLSVEIKSDDAVRVTIAACMQPRKGSTRVTAPAARLSRAYFDKPLIAALKRAHRELADHGYHFRNAEPDLAEAHGFGDPYRRRLTQLAFLAPDIQRAILTGRQPPGLNLKRLTSSELPIEWDEQRMRFGFAMAG